MKTFESEQPFVPQTVCDWRGNLVLKCKGAKKPDDPAPAPSPVRETARAVSKRKQDMKAELANNKGLKTTKASRTLVNSLGDDQRKTLL